MNWRPAGLVALRYSCCYTETCKKKKGDHPIEKQSTTSRKKNNYRNETGSHPTTSTECQIDLPGL